MFNKVSIVIGMEREMITLHVKTCCAFSFRLYFVCIVLHLTKLISLFNLPCNPSAYGLKFNPSMDETTIKWGVIILL